MGRYYSGDIEGKFMFAVQNSNDADFFGVIGTEPNYLEYYFEKDDLPKVKDGIKKCLEKLGDLKLKIDEYFKKNNYYDNKEMAKEFKITAIKLAEALEWYARLKLGEKIKKCVEKNGECNFQAEL